MLSVVGKSLTPKLPVGSCLFDVVTTCTIRVCSIYHTQTRVVLATIVHVTGPNVQGWVHMYGIYLVCQEDKQSFTTQVLVLY